jgi:iron complex outermembrane receptor protein
MGDLSNTSDDHGISSDGSSPEKLEVLRGPASLLYGSNALGGVVNIITESIPTYIPNGIDGDFNLSTSSVNDEYVGCGDLHFGINKFSFHGNFFKRKSENYSDGDEKIVENSNLSSTGYQFGFSFIPSFGLGGMSYSNFSTNYGIPYSHLSENQHSDDEGPINIAMDKNEFRFQIESNKIGSFLNSFSLKAGYQDYMHNEILKKSGEIESSFGLKSYSADLSFNHKPIVKNLKGVFGFWLSNQKYTVSGEEAFTPNANYYGIAGYVLEQLQFENFTFQFGGRFEINNVEMPQTEISKTIFPSEEKSYYSLCGSLGIVFNLSEQISFFTNIANAFRAPTIEELSSFAIHGATATFDIGNRKLLNEKNLGLDLGFRLRKDHHIVELSIYYNFMNDFIFRSPNGKYYNPEGQTKFNDLNGFPVFQYSQGNARLFGFELKAQYELTRTLSITTIMDYANGKQSDQYLPQIPPFRFSIEQRYAEDNYWFGSIWKLTAAQNKVAPFESESPGYGIVDFYAGTKFLTGSFIHIINLRADNLFNQKYRDHLSATKDFAFMPGRNIQLSYKFLF